MQTIWQDVRYGLRGLASRPSFTLYSVIAYTVSQQTHEIGIRMALGATPVHVLRLVGLMGARLVALGAAIGLAASFAATRVIATQLWDL